MKTSMIIMVLTLSVFLKCKGQEEKPTIAVNDCESLITEQQDLLWTQLASFQNTYFPDESEQNYSWNYDFEKSKISVFKNKMPYLKIDFIHVGSIDAIEKTWTWSWSKLPKEKELKLQEVKAFGIENNCEKLINPTWFGTEKDAWNMVAITNYILNAQGGARHYTKTEYNYVVFTKIKKINYN